MYVNFTLPQKHLSAVHPGLTVRITTDAVEDTIDGVVVALDPQIDTATRSIQLQAEFSNTHRSVLPGMFASIEVVMPKLDEVLVVPKTAIAHATYGDSVFVIEELADEDGTPHLKAVQHFVQLGRSRGDYVSIVKGLKEGETVVSAGVFKLYNGAIVTVANEGQPEYRVAPVVNDA